MTTRIHCQLTLTDSASRDAFTDSGIQQLVELAGCDRQDVRVIERCDDAPILTLEMPESAFERLVNMDHRTCAAGCREPGIVQGKEVLETFYDIGNIRRMLSKMFTEEDLRAFCRARFPAVLDLLPPNPDKTALVNTLIDTIGQNSRMAHLLVFTKQHDAATHEKYGPYYLTPRSFPAQSKGGERTGTSRPAFRPAFFTLSFADCARAFTVGTLVSTGLSFLLRRVLMIPMSPALAPLTYFLMGTLIIAGILVGEAVTAATKFKRGQLLAIISVVCYWVGNILGSTLALTSMAGETLRIEAIPEYLSSGVLSSFSPIIAVIAGAILAYRYAR